MPISQVPSGPLCSSDVRCRRARCRVLRGAGVAVAGRGVLHQAACFGQGPATRFAFQAQRHLHVFQEREEAETLLAVDDHPVTIWEQPAACRPGAAVKLLVPMTQQVDLQEAVGEANEHQLVDDQAPRRRMKPRQVPEAFHLAMSLFRLPVILPPKTKAVSGSG